VSIASGENVGLGGPICLNNNNNTLYFVLVISLLQFELI
jgi:hypothetical protein